METSNPINIGSFQPKIFFLDKLPRISTTSPTTLRLDLAIHIFLSCSYFFSCHVIFSPCHVMFKMLYRFWHVFPFIYTILINSCIHIVFILLSMSCHIFYRILFIFSRRVQFVFMLCSCHVTVLCPALPSLLATPLKHSAHTDNEYNYRNTCHLTQF